MIFTVAGSGTAIPNAERGSPCCHLQISGTSVVFDIGSGSVRQLWRLGIDVRTINVLALSHFHPDHTADLLPLLFALRNPSFFKSGKMVLLGPDGTGDFFRGLENLYGRWVQPPGLDLEIIEMTGVARTFGEWKISCAPSGHTKESLAYRVDCGGRSVVYGGDSAMSDELVSLSAGTNLLVLECSYPEESPGEGHLVPSQAAKIAGRSKAERLLLTHFYPGTDKTDIMGATEEHYRGPVEFARDGYSTEV